MAKKTSTSDAYDEPIISEAEIIEENVDIPPTEFVGTDVRALVIPEKSKESGIYVYLGPSIRGVVTNGSIFSGTRSEILKRFESAAEKYPQISRLIIKDTAIAAAREKLAKGEGAISQAYNNLSKAMSEEA